MKTFLKWLAGVLAVFFLLVLTVAVILDAALETKPYIPEHAYLRINLQGPLPEYVAPDALESALGRTPFDMAKFRDVLEKAVVDERISGVILKIGFLQISMGEAQELVDVIRRFRSATHKSIYAFLGPGMTFTRDYYVASACDSVFMTPQANLLLTGLFSEITFYKDFFNKVGVQAEFVQVGDYKNAPDPYTRSSISPEQKQEMESLLDAWYGNIVDVLSGNRSLPKEKVETLINQKTGLSGLEAYHEGLADTVCYYDEIVPFFNTNQPLEELSAREYGRVPAAELEIRDQTRMAVVHCIGTITGGSHSEDYLMGRLAGAASFIDDMDRAANASAIKAIILRIDSPGGSAAASEIMWRAVQQAAEKKPVIASISSIGASGGYYIALPADTMVVQQGSIIGSIGIFAGKFNIKGLYEKLELKAESIKRGENAGLFSILQPWSDSERRVIRHLLENFYVDFKQKVAEGRGIDYDDIEDMAGGRVFTGQKAQTKNLADITGSFYDALRIAKERAGIDPAESVRLVYYPARKSLLADILSGIQIKRARSAGYLLKTLENTLTHWQGQPLALLPFRMEWRP